MTAVQGLNGRLLLLLSLTATQWVVAQDYVYVTLDMDGSQIGRQHSITVPAPVSAVSGVAVHIFDPREQASLTSIGYLGGIDRVVGAPGTPVVPGSNSWVEDDSMMVKSFDGPEVQYLEFGGQTATIAPDRPPVFTATIFLAEASACDEFGFHLLDATAVMFSADHGAFSTAQYALDTGGDAVPDGTLTRWGVDPDDPVPVPPAAYLVDYVDGPATGGPAMIRITFAGDIDLDRDVDLSDLAILLSGFGCTVHPCNGDLDSDGDTDLSDLTLLLSNFGSACN
jgi:hypothetical protein